MSADGQPTTAEVAELLGMSRVDLVQYVGATSSITAADLLDFAGADAKHASTVEAWLDGPTSTGRGGQSPRKTDRPSTGEVADRLGVERRRLLQFVDFHPDPRPTYVLGWAQAEPENEAAVRAWLDGRKSEPADLSGADPVARDDARRGRLVR